MILGPPLLVDPAQKVIDDVCADIAFDIINEPDSWTIRENDGPRDSRNSRLLTYHYDCLTIERTIGTRQFSSVDLEKHNWSLAHDLNRHVSYCFMRDPRKIPFSGKLIVRYYLIVARVLKERRIKGWFENSIQKDVDQLVLSYCGVVDEQDVNSIKIDKKMWVLHTVYVNSSAILEALKFFRDGLNDQARLRRESAKFMKKVRSLTAEEPK